MLFVNCSKEEIIEKEVIVPVKENVEVYNSSEFDDSYVFAIENGGFSAFLLNKEGFKVKEWSFDQKLGNDIEILHNGNFVAMFKQIVSPITFGGVGGEIKILNSDGSTQWSYLCADNNKVAHHDVEMLPNGNVLFLVWERLTPAQALNYGIEVQNDIFPEALYEVNPNSNQIVWEWHSYDHVIQDSNSLLPNFGQINQNPHRINFSYNSIQNGDIMHANGIDFDEQKNVIYMSVNFYSEVWVIDHSTTVSQSASSIGGNYNKGGDLLYRFGNPSAYNSNFGTRLFYNNHYPNLIKKEVPGKGNMLVYCNGTNIQQSTVFEIKLPNEFNLLTDSSNEPEVAWSFTDNDLFFNLISGAVRLKNGNTLITEGDYGIWEVTNQKDVVWKYKNPDFWLWRAYAYDKDDAAISNIGL